jgi:hypothetical protein
MQHKWQCGENELQKKEARPEFSSERAGVSHGEKRS